MEVVKRVNGTSDDRVTPEVLRTVTSVYPVNTPYANGKQLRTKTENNSGRRQAKRKEPQGSRDFKGAHLWLTQLPTSALTGVETGPSAVQIEDPGNGIGLNSQDIRVLRPVSVIIGCG